MTWVQKIRTLQHMMASHTTVAMFFDAALLNTPAEQFELVHKWIPEEYADFLRSYNGVQIHTAYLSGLTSTNVPNLGELERRWGSDPAYPMAIGEDGTGNAFMLHADGTIALQRSKDETTLTPLAASFNELLDQVLLGSRYHLLYSTTDDWALLLKELDW